MSLFPAWIIHTQSKLAVYDQVIYIFGLYGYNLAVIWTETTRKRVLANKEFVVLGSNKIFVDFTISGLRIDGMEATRPALRKSLK